MMSPAILKDTPAVATLVGDDTWLHWLLSVRHGGDASYAAVLAPMLREIRETLLDHANIHGAQAIADIGCGDGLAGFGALERHPHATVSFVDISPALIDHTRALAQQLDVTERCRFLVASAEALGAIPDASMDVVLVRAMLAYVDDKPAAVREFRRILRPGGRISIVDPIFQDNAFALAGLASRRRAGALDAGARYAELFHRLRSMHFPDSLEGIRGSSLTNHNERDLLRLFESTGFVNIHVRLHIDSVPSPAISWSAFLASAPRAGVPTVGEILRTRFSPAEQVEFEEMCRARIETGSNIERNVNAYLFADRAM